MSIPKKNKLWKELYLYALDNNLDILQDKDFESMFHEIIIEHLETGIDVIVLLKHKNNNLNPAAKTKEYIDNAVNLLIEEFSKKDEEVEIKTEEVFDLIKPEKRQYKKGKK